MKLITAIVALLLSPALVGAEETVKKCNACTFWGDAYDASNCRVYGELHTGGLIAYDRASEQCLDYYNVHVETIDPEQVARIFPNPDGTGGSLELFIDLLRDDADATSGAVYDLKRNEMPKFFREQPETENGPIGFVDEIKLGITRFDCKRNNGNDCWPAVREYYAQPGSASEFRILGLKLWHAVQKEKESEQQTVRMSICRDRTPSQSICGNLVLQIEELWRGNTEQDCDLFGLGPGPHRNQLGGDCRLDSGGGWFPIHMKQQTASASFTTVNAWMLAVTAALMTWLVAGL